MVKKHYDSLDFLRGLGIFFVLILHTSFYYYQDIYDIDMDNPSLIITLIGFLLMFAGLFAIVSGISHTVSFINYQSENPKRRLRYMMFQGLLVLVVAYLYFNITGPGIIHFDTRSMDESLLVSLINQGKFQPLTLDRVLYIDSLVMIGLNIILLALILYGIRKQFNNPKIVPIVLIGATLFMALSYVRIPLYEVYLKARDSQNVIITLLLNWFVNKNNPLLPFFAFGLFGMWIGLLLKHYSIKSIIKWVLPVSLAYLTAGIVGYILTPETMLERAIDPTWYFIMVMQIGLFLLMVLGALLFFDQKTKRTCFITTFIKRFGVAGLTPFFFEQIVSALIFLIIQAIYPIHFNMLITLIYGISLAILWGLWLKLWEKNGYRYGLEWIMGKILSRVSPSSKLEKLQGDSRG